MAAEAIQFKKFAKLHDTSIETNDITVIAGKPGTGKSYVMKFLYALFESFSRSENGEITKDHFDLLDGQDRGFFLNVSAYLALGKQAQDTKIYDLLKSHRYVEALNLYESRSETNKSFLKFIQDRIETQKELLESSSTEQIFFYLRNILNSIFRDINQINESFEVIMQNTYVKFDQNTLELKQKRDSKATLSEIVFVETPLILEFEKFITKEKFHTPYHIDTLLNQLVENYEFTDKEHDLFIKEFNQKVSEIIQGSIKSLGLLQYLVNNKVLKPNSILFWEEPEVHLHPTWQTKIADLFLYMAKNQIKIVFSTHSPYICDYLNAVSQKENTRDTISFNLFSFNDDETVSNVVVSPDNWNTIQKELLDPLEEIMWKYL